jgi:hypothetical protein
VQVFESVAIVERRKSQPIRAVTESGCISTSFDYWANPKHVKLGCSRI